MEKQIKSQKEVKENSEIACGHVLECCSRDIDCEATYHVLPTGKLVFKHCACY
ncbi:hypothetical protein ABES13_27745 [Bacillus pseudomycoides]|jgi:hypothetical protein|uniref:hypothetical protein n=1 Tax=Bacillus pseudomycoides TaxID=64104 RepID=UPI0015CF5006|nr:hypothetical protein [Bacillus pseudomycoides]